MDAAKAKLAEQWKKAEPSEQKKAAVLLSFEMCTPPTVRAISMHSLWVLVLQYLQCCTVDRRAVHEDAKHFLRVTTSGFQCNIFLLLGNKRSILDDRGICARKQNNKEMSQLGCTCIIDVFMKGL